MKKTTIKSLLTAAVLAIAVAVTLPSVGGVDVHAGTKKVTASKKIKNSTKVKSGSTIVKSKQFRKHAYISFTAPKAGTYTFTFSDISVSDGNYNRALGHYYLKTAIKSSYSNRVYYDNVKAKTEGGTNTVFQFATKNYDNRYISSGSKKNRYLKTRSATVKLNKGQTIYLDTYITSDKGQYKLKIKRK